MTTITINDDIASIVTDLDTAKRLIQKNSRCSSTIKAEVVTLTYGLDELNTLTSLVKTSKL